MSGGVQPPRAENELEGLLMRSLDLVTLHMPDRQEVLHHLEEALKLLRGTRDGIPPEELTSANDG